MKRDKSHRVLKKSSGKNGTTPINNLRNVNDASDLKLLLMQCTPESREQTDEILDGILKDNNGFKENTSYTEEESDAVNKSHFETPTRHSSAIKNEDREGSDKKILPTGNLNRTQRGNPVIGHQGETTRVMNKKRKSGRGKRYSKKRVPPGSIKFQGVLRKNAQKKFPFAGFSVDKNIENESKRIFKEDQKRIIRDGLEELKEGELYPVACKSCGRNISEIKKEDETDKFNKKIQKLKDLLSFEKMRYNELQEANLKLKSALDMWKDTSSKSSVETTSNSPDSVSTFTSPTNLQELQSEPKILQAETSSTTIPEEETVLSQEAIDNILQDLTVDSTSSLNAKQRDLKKTLAGLKKTIEEHEHSYEDLKNNYDTLCRMIRENIKHLQKVCADTNEKEVENIEESLIATVESIFEMEKKHKKEMHEFQKKLETVDEKYDESLHKSMTMKEKLDYYKRLAESRNVPKLKHIPQGKFAIVFTDVESSTALWMKDPKGMQEAIEMHNILLRNIIARHKGLEVKNEGDAYFVVFQNCKNALEFALDVQLRLRFMEWPKSLLKSTVPSVKEVIDKDTGEVLFRGLRVRIGIHYDEATMHIDDVTGRPDYFGSAISKAARVCALARGGQILMTNDAYEEIKNLSKSNIGIPVWTRRKGTARLRGMEEEPEILWLVQPQELSKREFPSILLTKGQKDQFPPSQTSSEKLTKRVSTPVLNISQIRSKLRNLRRPKK